MRKAQGCSSSVSRKSIKAICFGSRAVSVTRGTAQPAAKLAEQHHKKSVLAKKKSRARTTSAREQTRRERARKEGPGGKTASRESTFATKRPGRSEVTAPAESQKEAAARSWPLVPAAGGPRVCPFSVRVPGLASFRRPLASRHARLNRNAYLKSLSDLARANSRRLSPYAASQIPRVVAGSVQSRSLQCGCGGCLSRSSVSPIWASAGQADDDGAALRQGDSDPARGHGRGRQDVQNLSDQDPAVKP